MLNPKWLRVCSSSRRHLGSSDSGWSGPCPLLLTGESHPCSEAAQRPLPPPPHPLAAPAVRAPGFSGLGVIQRAADGGSRPVLRQCTLARFPFAPLALLNCLASASCSVTVPTGVLCKQTPHRARLSGAVDASSLSGQGPPGAEGSLPLAPRALPSGTKTLTSSATGSQPPARFSSWFF